MVVLFFMVVFLGIATIICFMYCLTTILVEESDKPHGKYAVLYNANTDTYSEPYIKWEWLHYQKYRAVRWAHIVGTIVCFFGSFGLFYLASFINTIICG